MGKGGRVTRRNRMRAAEGVGQLLRRGIGTWRTLPLGSL